jgi:phosphoglycolate phosphatase-like HAD superfamily hydrolase
LVLWDIDHTLIETRGVGRLVDIGAYGTDDDTRASLVGIARLRAEKAHGVNFDAAATVLIGDTPNDVAAAQTSGARIIAVATGKDPA